MGSIPTALEASSWGIETSGLSRSFGSTAAVADLALGVPEGAIYLLAGQNGAGKTTALRLLLGLLRPDGGEARVAGVKADASGDVRARIGYVPETYQIPWGSMRVAGLLDQHARYRRTWDRAYARHLCSMLEIDESRRLGAQSKGQLRRIQLVLALAHRPSVLLLDEPTDGLDPLVRDTVLRLLVEHAADAPTTMLVASHVVHELDGLADHVGVLRNGRLIAQLTRSELHSRLRRYRFRAAADWQAPELEVAHRHERLGEHDWTIWGDEHTVAARLADSGAVLGATTPLSLDEAMITLLRMAAP